MKNISTFIPYLSVKVANTSRAGRAIVLAILAVLSALLTTYATWDRGFFLVNGAPVVPGIYFGLVLSVGVFCWITRSKSELFTVLVITSIAWILAYQTTLYVYESIDRELLRIQRQVAPDIASVVAGYQVDYVLALCGALGGLVGSFVTGAGISFVSKQFYYSGNLARTIVIGMTAGTLLEFAVSAGGGMAPGSLPVHGSLLPLFLVWQSSVAASIGYGLTARDDFE